MNTDEPTRAPTRGPQTLDQLRREALALDPGRPAVIWYGPNAARIELSGTTLANAIAKTATLLAEEIEPGDVVRLELPLHWQLAVWLGACAAGGWPVEVGPASGQAALNVTSPGVTPSGSGRHAVVSLDPFGRPEGDIPSGALDVATEARAQPDYFQPFDIPSPTNLALQIAGESWTGAQVVAAAQESALEWESQPGDRVATMHPATDLIGVLAALWAPLAAGACSVLIAPDMPPEVADQERASRLVR